MRFNSKQIDKLLDSNGGVTSFTTSVATSDDITTEVQAILTALGVTETVATATVEGVVVAGNNRVEIYDSTTKQKIDDGVGNEVYGRMSGGVGAWVLSYYSLVNGVETAFTEDASDIDFDFGIRFKFDDLPVNAIRSVKQKINDDVNGSNGNLFTETTTIVAQNTLPDTTKQTTDVDSLIVYVNDKSEGTVGATPSITASLVNETLVWNTANAGYNLETTDDVRYAYITKET